MSSLSPVHALQLITNLQSNTYKCATSNGTSCKLVSKTSNNSVKVTVNKGKNENKTTTTTSCKTTGKKKISGTKAVAETVNKPKRNPKISPSDLGKMYDELIAKIEVVKPFTHHHTSKGAPSIPVFKKMLKDICNSNNIKWPFKSDKQFNVAIMNTLIFEIPCKTGNKSSVGYHWGPLHTKQYTRQIRAASKKENPPVTPDEVFANPNLVTKNFKMTNEMFDDAMRHLTNQLSPKDIDILEHKPEVMEFTEILNTSASSGKNNVKCLLVNTPPGLGKTEALKNWIGQYHEDTKIICISFRKTLGDKQASDFAGQGMKSYQEISTPSIDIEVHQKLTIQLDSIQRLTNIDKFDGILVLDECESLFSHWCTSPYIQSQYQVMRKLACMMRRAKLNVLLDANMTDSTYRFLTRCLKLQTVVYKNTFMRNRRYLSFYSHKYQIEKGIIDTLKSGKRCVYYTGCQKDGPLFEQELQNEKYGLGDKKVILLDKNFTYKKKKDDNGNNIEEDPIYIIDDYDLAIITPKFQAGNSYINQRFHCAFAYFTPASTAPEAFSQLIQRIRILAENNVYIYASPSIGPKNKQRLNRDIISLEQYFDIAQNQSNVANNLFTVVSKKGASTSHLIWDSDYTHIKLNDPSTYMCIVQRYIENEGLKSPVMRLCAILKTHGFEYKEYLGASELDDAQSKIDEKDFAEREKANKEYIQTVDLQQIANAPKVEGKKLLKLKKKNRLGEATPEEKSMIRKAKILESFKLKDHTDIEAIERAIKHKYTKKLMQMLLPTVGIDVNSESYTQHMDIQHLRVIMSDIAYKAPIDVSLENKLQSFYDLDNNMRALRIMCLINILRKLGFKDDVFDTNSIIVNLDEACTFINDPYILNQINAAFNNKCTEIQRSPKGLIKWLNVYLKGAFDIEIIKSTTSKRADINVKRHLKSPWILNCDKMDGYGYITPRVLHYDEKSKITCEQYRVQASNIKKDIVAYYAKEKLIVPFEESCKVSGEFYDYKYDSTNEQLLKYDQYKYDLGLKPGKLYIIHNIPSFNYYVKHAKTIGDEDLLCKSVVYAFEYSAFKGYQALLSKCDRDGSTIPLPNAYIISRLCNFFSEVHDDSSNITCNLNK